MRRRLSWVKRLFAVWGLLAFWLLARTLRPCRSPKTFSIARTCQHTETLKSPRLSLRPLRSFSLRRPEAAPGRRKTWPSARSQRSTPVGWRGPSRRVGGSLPLRTQGSSAGTRASVAAPASPSRRRACALAVLLRRGPLLRRQVAQGLAGPRAGVVLSGRNKSGQCGAGSNRLLLHQLRRCPTRRSALHHRTAASTRGTAQVALTATSGRVILRRSPARSGERSPSGRASGSPAR